jgi:D-arabinose 1-dehydrogenase-like Zn-dependent alcohol dehydrogenase
VGSLVATKAQVLELLDIVDKHGIRSHITTVTLDQVPELPDRYMDKHRKGRLVMKIESWPCYSAVVNNAKTISP